MSERRWLSPEAAADYLDVRVDALPRLVRAGRIPGPHPPKGTNRVWDREEIDRCLSGKRPAPSASSGPDGPTQLYRHFDVDGVLLYVGISLNALLRLAQHQAASAWFLEITRVEIELFADRSAALEAEKRAIRDERPKYNITHSMGCDEYA